MTSTTGAPFVHTHACIASGHAPSSPLKDDEQKEGCEDRHAQVQLAQTGGGAESQALRDGGCATEEQGARRN